VSGTFKHRRTVRKSILIGAVATGVVGALGIGSVAYTALDKTVTLSVDGQTRTIHTFGSTVGDVLAAEKLQVSSRDVVAPGPEAKLVDGARVAVRYARPLTLTVDGKQSKHWVTALSVNGAFDELGLRYNGAALSASRSAGIERQGISLDVKTLKRLAVVHDGKTTSVDATALTVGDALKQANIAVDNDDLVSPKLTTALADGTKVTIKRVSTVTRHVDVKIPYKKVKKDDDSLYEDQSKTEREGVNGLKRQVVRLTLVDGKQTKSVLVSESVVRKAIDKITLVGTKERPEENGGGGGGGNVGGGVDGLNWAALAECESGGNPRAVNPNGHYGLYQFSLSTWRSVGGSGNPIDASAGEQTYRAKLLYKKAGAGQWSCGSHLYD
jgi:uncharacterized protein YabE (DUF348 family)